MINNTDRLKSDKKSSLVSKNITLAGKRTSMRLEPEMWAAIRDIAMREQCSIHDICTLVDFRKKINTSLTAAIRVFIMLYYKAATTEEGHSRVGHGSFELMKSRARISNDDEFIPHGRIPKEGSFQFL